MENCAATVRVLPLSSQTIPSMSAEDCTAHRDSLVSWSIAFWRGAEGLVVERKGSENGQDRADETTD
jgi:hypothetical protein